MWMVNRLVVDLRLVHLECSPMYVKFEDLLAAPVDMLPSKWIYFRALVRDI